MRKDGAAEFRREKVEETRKKKGAILFLLLPRNFSTFPFFHNSFYPVLFPSPKASREESTLVITPIPYKESLSTLFKFQTLVCFSSDAENKRCGSPDRC